MTKFVQIAVSEIQVGKDIYSNVTALDDKGGVYVYRDVIGGCNLEPHWEKLPPHPDKELTPKEEGK